jgi:nucleotide-binding universal stress UspA family protein
MINFKRIICPVDFSNPSFAALNAAKGIAMQYSSELFLVTVVEPVVTGLLLGKYSYQLYERRLKSAARKSLSRVIKKRIPKKVKAHPVVTSGEPADEIVKIAKRKNADVIVIATHGRKGWGHLLFGSVAEKVVRLAPCPVLVIHGPRIKARVQKRKRR